MEPKTLASVFAEYNGFSRVALRYFYLKKPFAACHVTLKVRLFVACVSIWIIPNPYSFVLACQSTL